MSGLLSHHQKPLALSLGLIAAALLCFLLAPGLLRGLLYPAAGPGAGLSLETTGEGRQRLAGFLEVTWPGRWELGLAGPGRLFLDGQIRLEARQEGRQGRQGQPALVRVWLEPGRHLLEADFPAGAAPEGPLWRSPGGVLEPLPATRLAPLAAPLGSEQAEILGEQARQLMIPFTLLLIWLVFAGLVLIWPAGRELRPHLLASSLVMGLAIWLSSGTMAVYAASGLRPMVFFPCEYLVNPDHSKFWSTLHLLNGEPRWLWETSVVLRRILYPLLAYLPMKALGFLGGGVATNLALHLIALASWGLWLRARLGGQASRWGLWLLALYPGVTYWAGLPYSYAMVAPCTLWAFMLLELMGRDQSPRALAWASLGLGLLFLGYDLIFFFAPAAVLLTLWQTRRLSLAALTIPGLLLPTIATLAWLASLGAYAADPAHEPVAVLKAYLAWPDWAAWAGLLARAPLDLAETFLASNYLLLPGAFLLFWLAGRRWGLRLGRAEVCLLLAGLLTWAVINLAPPFSGWHRGVHNSARFYQPIFVALMFHVLKVTQAGQAGLAVHRAWPRWVLALLLTASALVSFGAPFTNPLAEEAYWRFYQQHGRHSLSQHLERYGRRPLGICPAQKVRPPQGFTPQAPRSAG